MAMKRPNQAIGGPDPVRAVVLEPEDAEMESESEEELRRLESEVKQMAEKILHFRRTLPDQLKDAFSLLASAHRPELPPVELGSAAGPSSSSHQGLSRNSEPGEDSSVSDRERETAKKIELLKEKTLKNVSGMPVLLKRMKECISTIDNLNSNPSSIHPAFRKERTS
ncbi:uncharacterized protein LOC116200500 [Punica granatum]|uniref:Uncharacterized protein n=2 Tax=Punica granatum TaxID=22663 RepID=A0A218VVX0_PUNGR|nr:uncharacterized protein LOC116200500 [Punica granatum]OWM64240.1 hypothetical protein CDL15_Pgr018812 [Punica granatum]PKI39987.1 hypothetical protein CRG98_039650 [Punica granatum]